MGYYVCSTKLFCPPSLHATIVLKRLLFHVYMCRDDPPARGVTQPIN